MLDAATVTRLGALTGLARARALLFLADTISGDYAAAIGLVNRIFEPAEIESRPDGITQKIIETNPQVEQKLKGQADAAVHALARVSQSQWREDRLIVQGFHRAKG
jgi:enoyl-CoA hydratase/carnithine racemase